jgi:hypothetical protein
MTIKLKNSNIFSPTFLVVFHQHFIKCYNIFGTNIFVINIFLLVPTFLRNDGFVNYFLSTLNVGQHFFHLVLRLVQAFFKNVTTYLRNVGFVNYFLSTFCKMLQYF